MTITAPVPPSPPSTAAALLPEWWPIAREAGPLRSLAPAQCLELLPDLGRGWLFYPQEPHTSQVAASYRVQGASLLVSPEPSPTLMAAPLVLYRVDHLDVERRSGWTVVVAGPLRAGRPDALPRPSRGRRAPLVLDLLNLAGRYIGGLPTRDELTTVA